MVYPYQEFATDYGYSHSCAADKQPCADPCACKLKIEGTGSIKVQPNKAEVVLGVVTEDEQLKIAQEENAARMTAVITVLTELGIVSEVITGKEDMQHLEI